jgi:hypothetical protein
LKLTPSEKEQCITDWEVSVWQVIITKTKFKQWWSTIPPILISTKQTITSHHDSLNIKKRPWHMHGGNPSHSLGQAQKCGGLNLLIRSQPSNLISIVMWCKQHVNHVINRLICYKLFSDCGVLFIMIMWSCPSSISVNIWFTYIQLLFTNKMLHAMSC